MALPFSTTADATGQLPNLLGLPFSGVAGNTPFNNSGAVDGVTNGHSYADDAVGQYLENGQQRMNYMFNVTLGRGDINRRILNEMEMNALIFLSSKSRNNRFDINGFRQARALSMLNFHLRSEEGRAKYGANPFGQDVLKDWPFMGVQQTDLTPALYSKKQDAAFTVHVGMRARTANIWLMLGKVDIDDRLWLVLRRRELSSPLNSVFDDFEDATMDGPEEKALNLLSTSATAASRRRGPVPSTYWVWEPHIERGSGLPPADLYSGLYWQGCCVYVGRVSVIYNEQSSPAQWANMCHKVCFPTHPGEEWKKLHRSLPDVEVQLGVF